MFFGELSNACSAATNMLSLSKCVLIIYCVFNAVVLYATEIKIVYANQWHPYSVGDGVNVQWILPDLIERLLSEKLDYTVRHMGVPWNRAQSMVRSGEADGFVTAVTAER